MADDPGLWLSRSWTTRARRPGEPDDAYVFVDRADLRGARVEPGGFFEWAEFLGQPVRDPGPRATGPGVDVLLEIDLQGARQVRRLRPDATLILLLPPSPEAQEARLRARGDDESHIAERLRAGAEEERHGQGHRRRRGGQSRRDAGHRRGGRYSGALPSRRPPGRRRGRRSPPAVPAIPGTRRPSPDDRPEGS